MKIAGEWVNPQRQTQLACLCLILRVKPNEAKEDFYFGYTLIQT